MKHFLREKLKTACEKLEIKLIDKIPDIDRSILLRKVLRISTNETFNTKIVVKNNLWIREEELEFINRNFSHVTNIVYVCGLLSPELNHNFTTSLTDISEDGYELHVEGLKRSDESMKKEDINKIYKEFYNEVDKLLNKLYHLGDMYDKI